VTRLAPVALLLLPAVLPAAADPPADGPYTATYPNGKVRAKGTYKAGELDGPYTTYHPSGKVLAAAAYKAGKRHGAYTEKTAAGVTRLTATYEAGALAGPVRLPAGGGPGAVLEVKPDGPQLPRMPADLQLALADVALAPPPPGADAAGKDAVAALRRLQAYRAAVGVPWEGMELDPEKAKLADGAAAACQALGTLTHAPANPGWPEDRFAVARAGAEQSNLYRSRRATLADTVTGYMDDSDPKNIDRVAHRRWCLNPAMLRTGFGRAGEFSAMFAHDRSRADVPDFDAVCYPAPGFFPVDLFGEGYAWSVSPNPRKYRTPGPDVKVTVYRVTGRGLEPGPKDPPLKLNYANVETTRMGTGPAVVFRPDRPGIGPGARFWVEVTGLVREGDGAPHALRFPVVFVALN
jgi:hypothetical protein